jgi:hypothetical protein
MSEYFQYPDRGELTLAKLYDTGSIIANGNFSQRNVQILCNYTYLLTGVVLSETVGMPDSFGEAYKNEKFSELEEIKRLERISQNYIELQSRFGAETQPVSPESKVNPATILFIIKSVFELIQLLKQKENK